MWLSPRPHDRRIRPVPHSEHHDRTNRQPSASFEPGGGSASWLNLVEVFFGVLTRQAIRRGTFGSVRELIDAITRFIDGWNERCEPFVWTKDVDTIIAKAHRKSTSSTRH